VDARHPLLDAREISDSPAVRVVRGDLPGGKAATLNAAVRVATGDLLLFTDAQQRFAEGAIERLVDAFRDDSVGAASGRLELSERARRSPIGRYWSYERWLRRCEGTLSSCVGATGAIWALRRSLWSPLPAALILDDVYAPMRVVLGGSRVVFVDGARAVDLRQPNPGQEYRRKVRTLTGVVQLCCWLPQLLVPARNPIWAQFVFHKLLRLLTPYWLIGMATWAGWLVVHWLETDPVVTGVPLLAFAGLTAIRRSRVARLVRGGIIWGVTLQAAVVVAAMNGIRRHWDVWGA
jgi:cellulose synthase/poly-beta-1,6-N-acetylglucosamine synthase-like glycosyltransferase